MPGGFIFYLALMILPLLLSIICIKLSPFASLWEWLLYCSAIYASPTYTIRLKLWEHLMDLRNLNLGPWIMIGDFNEVRNYREVSGGDFNLSRTNLLSQMMDACGVMDLDTIGCLFTWRRNSQYGDHISKKLDRCLADVNWRLAFPHFLAELLPTHDSDHNLILMSCMKAVRVGGLRFFTFKQLGFIQTINL